MAEDDYPGKGNAMLDFLHHRIRVIEELRKDGKSWEEIARELSMDERKVRMIHETRRMRDDH